MLHLIFGHKFTINHADIACLFIMEVLYIMLCWVAAAAFGRLKIWLIGVFLKIELDK